MLGRKELIYKMLIVFFLVVVIIFYFVMEFRKLFLENFGSLKRSDGRDF